MASCFEAKVKDEDIKLNTVASFLCILGLKNEYECPFLNSLKDVQSFMHKVMLLYCFKIKLFASVNDYINKNRLYHADKCNLLLKIFKY